MNHPVLQANFNDVIYRSKLQSYIRHLSFRLRPDVNPHSFSSSEPGPLRGSGDIASYA